MKIIIAAKNRPAWCKKSYEKEGNACGFWHTTRALIYKKDCATRKDVHKFRVDTREFLVTLLEKMFDKKPISFNIVKYASVLDPKVLVPQLLNVWKSLSQRLLFTLVHLEIKGSSQADLALYEFSSFYHTNLGERKTSFESFQKQCDHLDDVYTKEANICNYKTLSSVFKLVLVFSHGQVLNVNMHEILLLPLNWSLTI